MVKISRPVLRGAYIRQRLFERLDELRRKPVTWVSAPAGSGKTTLVASYIAQGKIPCLWYQLDAGDSDLATFFYYMGQAGLKAAPRRKKNLPLLTPEYLPGIHTFTLRYFEELFSRLPKPSLIVFDNYQDVPSESPLHDVMQHALSIMPEGINAVLISRSDPPPAFIRLKAGWMMEVLSWEDVRLREEESDAIIRMRIAGEDNPETIRELHKLSDGWAAGLTLMTEALGRKGLLPEALGKYTQAEIFTYFAQEVFDGLDEQVQTFMLKTAYLPRMTADMARELTGEARADTILSDMYKRNYFLSECFDPAPTYEYHPLYRDFLLARTGQNLSPEELTGVRRTAAALLEKSGQTVEAVALLRDNADWEGITGIIMAHAPEMVAQGRYIPLHDWMRSLPEADLSGNPWLIYWKGMSVLIFEPLDAKSLFEAAYAMFHAAADSMGSLMAASAVMNAIFIGADDYRPLDHWFKVVDDLVRRMQFFPSPEIEAWVTAGMMTAIGLREIVHPEADVWAGRVLTLKESPATLIPKTNGLFQLFWVSAMRSGLSEIETAGRALKRMAAARDTHPMVVLTSKNVECIYYQIAGMTEACLKTGAEGLELSRKCGILFLDFSFIVVRVSSLLDRMECHGARELLAESQSTSAIKSHHGRSAYFMYSTREALLSAEPERALAQAEQLYQLLSALKSPYGYGMCLMKRALALNALGRKAAARQDLDEIFAIAEASASLWGRMFAFYTKAYFAFEDGDETSGLGALRESLMLARKSGYVYCTDDHPLITACLCLKALKAGIETDYVRTIIRRRRLSPPPDVDATLVLDVWPFPITIYTLGRFEIVRDDGPLVFSGKVQKKPLEMLKAIIAMGGAHVPASGLTDALWPDAEGDLAHKSFQTTLGRLRRLLGSDDVITYRAGELGLDPLYCRVDSQVLESVIEAAAKAPLDESVRLCETAVRLYKGPFLPADAGLSWSIHRREILHNRILRIIITTGQHYEDAGQWEKALGYYSLGLATDPLAEAFYQRRMVCCKALGYHAEAVKTYQQCHNLLNDQLGINPSSTTEAIYSAILKNR